MTKREAAIVGAYTGVLIGSFDDMMEYIEEKLGRPVFTHELASRDVVEEIKTSAIKDFMDIEVVK